PLAMASRPPPTSNLNQTSSTTSIDSMDSNSPYNSNLPLTYAAAAIFKPGETQKCLKPSNLTYNLQTSNNNTYNNSIKTVICQQQHCQQMKSASAADDNSNSAATARASSAHNSDTKKYPAPSRKMAIVIENTKEFSQDELLRAVADLVGGKNIQYCSRLSGGRFCLYLTNESAVTTLCHLGGVHVSNTFLSCRRYFTEATKFVISNCPPEMTDGALQKLLEPYGKIVSTPTRLGITTSHEDLKHIKTWKRSLYLQISNNAPSCPEIINITSEEGVKHTLYIKECKERQNMKENFSDPGYTPSPSLRLAIPKEKNPSKTNLLNPNCSKDKPSQEESAKHQENLTSNITRLPPEAVDATQPRSRTVPALPASHHLPISVSVSTKPQPAEPAPKKRLLSPQSPQLVTSKIPKQTIYESNDWQVVPSYDTHELKKTISVMSFNSDELSSTHFNFFVRQCQTGVNPKELAIRRKLAIPELINKLSQAKLFEARVKHIIKCENCHLNLINIKICECEKRVNQRKSTTVIDGTTYFSDLDEDEEN
ncbi:hypothetical protein KUF71_025205, partial [Frankliniella fusca]